MTTADQTTTWQRDDRVNVLFGPLEGQTGIVSAVSTFGMVRVATRPGIRSIPPATSHRRPLSPTAARWAPTLAPS
jgi:hypothetical protein